MNTLRLSTLVACLLPALAHSATLIHAGTVITAEGKQILQQQTIVVDGDKISAITSGFKAAGSGDTVLDLSKYTVMPGLMDMHTHFSSQSSPTSYTEGFSMNEADYALRGAVFARKTLLAGFTTVRELGDSYHISTALRKAIDAGYTEGPRIFTAGTAIATTGGHADPTNGVAYDRMGNPGPDQGVINGPDEARKAVRQRYKEGADLIKITATGGVLSVAKSGKNSQFSDEELKAIVDTAKDYNFTVAVHAHGKEGMERAIKAGVTSIEHGTFMDDNTMALMKQHGTYLVPTLSAGKFVAEKAKIPGYFPEIVRLKAAATGPLMQQMFSRAYKAGVRIAFGTDAGVGMHGDNWKEFVYMTEAGMPAHEAILAATINAATVLQQQDTLGSIKVGKVADLVAVAGDPLQNIQLMNNVSFVMKAGQIYKRPD